MGRAGLVLAAAMATGAALVISACSAAGAAAPAGTVRIVASTNVWGDIAAQIGGDAVEVTSLINDPSQDPHSFQPAGRDELAVARADLVIVNGGGYDDVLGQMVAATDSHASVLNAVDTVARSGIDLDDNEHVWMDPAAVDAVAARIAQLLRQADPARAEEFDANRRALHRDLARVEQRIDEIRSRYAGTPVAITEPLPLPLVWAAGLHNVMPEAVSEALEEGIDVSPTLLRDAAGVLTDRRAAVLLYNEQSLTAQVEQLLDAAREGGVPTVRTSELLPHGTTHYQQWMTTTIRALSAALASGAQR